MCQNSPLWLQKYMYSFLSLVYCCHTCTCMYIDVLELERQIKHCLYTKVDFSSNSCHVHGVSFTGLDWTGLDWTAGSSLTIVLGFAEYQIDGKQQWIID